MSHGADLHTHSSASDGELSPEQLVEHAIEAGLEAVALTDHDTVSGVGRALSAAQGKGIVVVPGVEISCAVKTGQCHMLGYFIDHESPYLRQPLEFLREKRRSRATEIMEKLARLGMPVEIPGRPDSASVGRPHIAAAMVAAGYVHTNEEAFRRFIGTDQPAYVPSPKLLPYEAMEMILRAGGVPVLAHPHTFPDLNMIRVYAKEGLLGLEARYCTYTEPEVRRWTKLCRELNLVPTVGSDFHGPSRPDRALGCVRAEMSIVEELKNKRRN